MLVPTSLSMSRLMRDIESGSRILNKASLLLDSWGRWEIIEVSQSTKLKRSQWQEKLRERFRTSGSDLASDRAQVSEMGI